MPKMQKVNVEIIKGPNFQEAEKRYYQLLGEILKDKIRTDPAFREKLNKKSRRLCNEYFGSQTEQASS